MNYYERHIGDYLKDTAHLSLLEHGVYTRLLDVYYTREEPLPAADIARLIGARSKEEREALQAVLREFFRPDQEPPTAWLQPRCEVEIGRYGEKRRKAKASADARWSQTERNANASPNAMRSHSEGNAPSHQSPVTSHQGVHTASPPPTPTRAGSAVLRMKARGLTSGISPSHPKLLALLEAGVTDDELADAAAEAVSKGKTFAYALAVAEGRRRDAANGEAIPGAAAPPDWREIRREVIDRGCRLGIGPWDEVAAYNRTGPSWAAYRGKVIEAWTAQQGKAA